MASDWHVLGAGSIGSLFASALSRTGCATTLIVRVDDSTLRDANNPAAIKFEARGQLSEILVPTSAASEPAYISHLLVTTKAFDAGAALATIAHRLDQHSHILLLLNGMGILQQLELEFPELRFYCGITTEGVYQKPTKEYVHAGTGTTKVGRRDCKNPPAWFDDWSKLSLSCVWVEDIDAAQWQKLAVNCAINPLTALFRCNNGDLLSRPDLAVKLAALCDEIAAISVAAGQNLTALGLRQMVEGVIEKTADNRSSMLQDVLARRCTEIDYISGYLVNVARRLDIPAPINESLLQRIREVTIESPRGGDSNDPDCQ